MKLRTVPIVLLCLIPCGAACSGSPATAGSGDAKSGPAIVFGQVLDARSGEPVEDAQVRGPRDTHAKSDARGRFELRGLEVGDSGTLSARAEDGRTAEIALRPLKGGRLEVVLHVASHGRND